MFFLSLFQVAGGTNMSVDDLQKGPPPVTIDEVNSHTTNKIHELLVQPAPGTSELQAELNAVRQELQLLPRQELGTMAQLQQDNLPWVTFDSTPEAVPSSTPGTLFWDSNEGNQTLSLVMEGGDVVQQIGEEQYYRVRATGGAINNGEVVMFTGTVGATGILRGAPASGLTGDTALKVLGIATQDISNGSTGYVTSFGLVRGINTTGGAEAWVDGQILYLNPSVAGGLTKYAPTAPNPKVVVAAVVNAAGVANGSLFVRPTFGGLLGQFEGDVQITSAATGDLLQYDGTIWENVPASSVIAGAGGAPVTKTADFTVAAGETWLINNKSGSSCTVTLPTASASAGRVLHFQNYQAQTLVSASSNVVPLAGGSATTAILEAVAGANATLVSDGTNWIMTQYDSNNSLEIE